MNDIISITHIKKLLGKISHQGNFDKMIITSEKAVIRSAYTLVKFKYQKVEREVKIIKFPLYGDLKEKFVEIEGSTKRFGGKSIIKSNRIFEELETNYLIKDNVFDYSNAISNPFDFPLDVVNNEINPRQEKYFIPDLTYQEVCSECNGNKYIKCQKNECGGRHEYTCPKCDGYLKLDCNNCNKTGYIKCRKCSGSGEYKCSKCKGKGEIKCGQIMGCGGKGYTQLGNESPMKRCVKCSGRGYSPCAECRNGVIKCERCRTKGEIKCDDCVGRGEIDCKYCKVSGKIICKTCHGDKALYGMVDCPQCQKTGVMAQVVYIESIVSDEETEDIIIEGELAPPIKFDKILCKIKNHFNDNIQNQTIYHKANNLFINDCDEKSKMYANDFEKKLGLSKDSFPIITKEEISHQTVVCVQSSYKHLMTNNTHDFLIIDFWNNPEVVFDGSSEQFVGGKDTVKIFLEFAHNIFCTKKSKYINDKMNEIIILIHFFKSGKYIKDDEKQLIREAVGDLNIFTNSHECPVITQTNSIGYVHNHH